MKLSLDSFDVTYAKFQQVWLDSNNNDSSSQKARAFLTAKILFGFPNTLWPHCCLSQEEFRNGENFKRWNTEFGKTVIKVILENRNGPGLDLKN